MSRGLAVVALAFGALACGDPATSDEGRGYTKAPLENPGLIISGEDVSSVASLGRTNRPRPRTDFDRPATPAGEEGASGEEAQVSLAPGVTQEQFDEGRDLFAGQGGCQACHGPGGSGSTLGPDLTDGQWLNISSADVGELADVIRNGVSQPQQYPAPMPPMGGANLNDQQVQALAGYIASLNQG